MIHAAIRRELQDLRRTVDEIDDLLGDGDSYILAELLLTIGTMNERLGDFADRLRGQSDVMPTDASPRLPGPLPGTTTAAVSPPRRRCF